MNLGNYLKDWQGALKENRISRVMIAALSVSNLVLAMMAFGKSETIVMLPPGLNERVEIGVSNGSPGLKEAWGTHVALMLGNATPLTAPFLAEQMGRITSPRLYQSIQEQLAAQAKTLKDEGLSVSFTPTTTFVLPERDVVVVSGQYMLRGMRGMERTMVRTYEVGVRIKDYRVRVETLDVYEGAWSQAKEVERQKAETGAVASR